MYKILSIDGGGIKGVFPASFLATLEANYKTKINAHFDLLVGTSTGGIIALGLASGLAANELLGFYEDKGPYIFEKRRLSKLKDFFSSKYDNETLKTALESTFGNMRMRECQNRVVIPATNMETGEVIIYKTKHQDNIPDDSNEKIVDVALATAAAPTYFPHHVSSKSMPLVDGGLWANNPINVAVTEAIGILGWPKDNIKVLSIGCTEEALNMNTQRSNDEGKLFWIQSLLNLMFSTQSSAALSTAQVILGKENIFRVSPFVSENKFKLDDPSCINSLKGLGNSIARKNIDTLQQFFETKTIPFKRG